ncbi:MAG: hypothetical protein P8X57_07280 [Cyclobacteriaceae bacterium]
MFSEGNTVDPFLLADSERILRQYSFINDARIYMLPSLENENNVEVIVAIQDRFPWSVNIGFSSFSKYNFTLSHQNISGSANELYAGFFKNSNGNPVTGYSAGYISAPFKRTFTRAELFIENNYNRKARGITVDKPFVSPVIEWGGRLGIYDMSKDVEFVLGDSTYESGYKMDMADIWVARAWRPFRNDRKSITLGFRGILTSFDLRPEVTTDSNTIFLDRSTYLVALDYHKSNFVKTSNVQSIGITEDLPVGYSYGSTIGANFTEFADEWYLGLRGQWNDFRDFGYVSIHSEIGGFRNKSRWSEGIWDSEVSYMSPLMYLGLNTFRAFVSINYVQSMNLSLPLSIRLADYIDGLNGYYTRGEEVFVLSIEPVLFSRWYWLGFRFAPYVTLQIGQVRESRIKPSYNETYPALGGGFRITNPGLILSSLEISGKFFTNSPENGNTFYFDISLSTRLPFRLNRSEVPVVLPYSEYNFFR